MASERTQRRIDSLLDEAEEAIAQLDWQVVQSRAQAVIALDPDNPDARNYLAAADRACNFLQQRSASGVDVSRRITIVGDGGLGNQDMGFTPEVYRLFLDGEDVSKRAIQARLGGAGPPAAGRGAGTHQSWRRSGTLSKGEQSHT